MEWAILIQSFLQPLLLKCFDRTSTENPQDVLRRNYDPITGHMDSDLVEDAIPAARRAVHRARKSLSREERKTFPKLSYNQLYELAEKNLIDAMNASPEAVTQCRSVAASLRDSDDD
jgi:hypothetical protein